jgi:hypothetical protein
MSCELESHGQTTTDVEDPAPGEMLGVPTTLPAPVMVKASAAIPVPNPFAI